MGSKARHGGTTAEAPRRGAPLELRIGHETVNIWFDDSGIHFRHAEGKRTEGVLPWDVAMAMSLVPEGMRRQPTHPAG